MRGAIGVASALLPNGQYVCEITVDDDTAFTLDGVAGLRYVAEVAKASVYCRHDAALAAAMLEHDLTIEMVATVVGEHRRRRPRIIPAATRPLRFEPGVSPEVKPFVHVYHNDTPISQWSPRATLGHAMYVAEVLAAAGADNSLFHTLRMDFKMPEPISRAIIDGLGKHIDSIDIDDED